MFYGNKRYTHKDCIRDFYESGQNCRLIDFCNRGDAYLAAVTMRSWISERDLQEEVKIIQRNRDLILYRPSLQGE